MAKRKKALANKEEWVWLPPVGLGVKKRKDMVAEKKYGFEIPPHPIPESDIKEAITSEVVVVGGGLAGLSAALSAAEDGAKVLLIEKTAKYQARGYENAFIGSRLQKRLGIEIDRDKVILDLVKYGVNKPDQRLIRMWAEGSGATADWLMDMTDTAGLKVVMHQFPPPHAFNNANEYYPQYLVTHRYEDERFVAKCLMDNALKKGVIIRFRTRAEQLLRKGKGRVTGVMARNKEGYYLRFNASKAVVLCTGDYGNNSEMMAKYCPQAAYLRSITPTSTGDGHQMAMWVGAVMEPVPHAPISHGFAGCLGNAAFLQINTKGERFHNEDVPSQSYANAVERQPGQTAWQVFDSKYPDEIPYMGIGHGKITEVNDTVKEHVHKNALRAGNIGELAAKMGVPTDAFKATVARYNELARLGKDLDFGKRADRLTTIDRPPYYASKGFYGLLAVMGGLNINTKLQALDKDWQAIPGLYLAGNTMGNRFAVDYPTICPGLTHGMALHFGRIAGLNAAAQEP